MDSKQSSKQEVAINALLFTGALIILVTSPIGILSIPGIVVAILAIVCVLTRRPWGSACLGLLTASGSFIGQSLTAFCMSCTIAATLFLLGGLLPLRWVVTKRMTASLGILGALVVCLSVFSFSITTNDQRNPVIASTPTVVLNQNTPSGIKPLLFLSPTCKGCKDVMATMVQKDPKGNSWQPVVVPHIALSQGEKLLRDKGYQGEIVSAAKPPGRTIPVMQDGEKVYTGKELREHLKDLIK